MRRPMIGLIAAVTMAVTMAACGKSTQVTPVKATPAFTPVVTPVPYTPKIDPANFSPNITNTYFPLPVGTTRIYEGVRDGAPMKHEVVVTADTKKILGVTARVVRDDVTSNGALVEKTTDWYAQDNEGTVWYFGEATAEYENGKVTNTHGSWEAGVDSAKPGIIMRRAPKVGQYYFQEYRPGEALDTAKILTIDSTITVKYGSFTNVITTEDADPLNPDKIDKKAYAPGVGLVRSERISTQHHENNQLVKVIKG